MTTQRFQPNSPSRYSVDESAKLFVHHLALAVSLWEIGGEEATTIDLSARNLSSNNYRRALYALLPILDHIYSETETDK